MVSEGELDAARRVYSELERNVEAIYGDGRFDGEFR